MKKRWNVSFVIIDEGSRDFLAWTERQINKEIKYRFDCDMMKSKVFNILTEFNRILIMKGKVFLQFPSLLKGKNVFHQSLITKNQLRSLTPRLEFYLKEELEILFEFAGIKILEIIEEETDFYVLGEKEKEIKKLNIVLRSPFKNEK